MRISKIFKARRASRAHSAFPVSAFTIVLLGLGLSYWTVNVMTLAPNTECRYAASWIAGWFEFASPFQWMGVAIAAAAVLWTARIIFLRRDVNAIETVLQGVFIAFLFLVFASHKAYLFPEGTPSRAQFESVYYAVYPNRIRLIEARQEILEWSYDYPPPPKVEFPEYPAWNPAANKRLTEIFKKEDSPFWSEYKEMQLCIANYDRALVQYETDQETLRQYWEGFYDWYAVNGRRYEE